MAVVGYARVSTDGQTLDAQHAALKAAGADNIFAEKVSGAKTDRRQLQRAIEALDAGDVLLVTRLDRLARSTRDLLNVLATISERGAGFRSIADAWTDTTTAHGRLMLTVLGGLAEFERSLIRERTNAGLAAARARGRTGGRPPKMNEADKKKAFDELFEAIKEHFKDLYSRRYLAISMEAGEFSEAGTYKHNNLHARFKKQNG